MNRIQQATMQKNVLVSSISQTLSVIEGIYRLIGCIALLDSKQQPYWRFKLSDCNGTKTMYMFEQAPVLDLIGHGSLVYVKGVVQTYQQQKYVSLMSVNLVNDYFALQNLHSIPATSCPKPELIGKLQNIVYEVKTPCLQSFIADTLKPIEVITSFLQAPASLNHHHNFPAGLLTHSIDTAEIVANLPVNTQIERDLAVVGGLLHDIGKIKSMDARMKRLETGKWVDHNAMTLELCAMPLAKLERKNNLYANVLRHIWTCKSPGARYGYSSKVAIADAVQLADRYSGLRDYQNKKRNYFQ